MKSRSLPLPVNGVFPALTVKAGHFPQRSDVKTLEVTRLFDLLAELGIHDAPHFKDAYTDHGRVVVANNSYYPKDFDRGFSDGRLAEWDGTEWRSLARTQFNTVAGRCAGRLGRATQTPTQKMPDGTDSELPK